MTTDRLAALLHADECEAESSIDGYEWDLCPRPHAAEAHRLSVLHGVIALTEYRLAAAINDAAVRPEEVSLGRDLRPVAARILARLAAGVTATPQPAEPSCCELACYEDPGCACDGCQPAATPAPARHCPGCQGWIEPEYLRREPCPGAATPAPALDVERIVRQTLGHVMSRVRLDLMAGAIDQTYSPAEVAVMVRQAAEAAAIARAYEEEEGR